MTSLLRPDQVAQTTETPDALELRGSFASAAHSISDSAWLERVYVGSGLLALALGMLFGYSVGTHHVVASVVAALLVLPALGVRWVAHRACVIRAVSLAAALEREASRRHSHI